MDRSAQFHDGYRRAAKQAVAWLHKRAVEMNDPHAKAVLDSAAFNLGQEFGRNVPSPTLDTNAGERWRVAGYDAVVVDPRRAGE